MRERAGRLTAAPSRQPAVWALSPWEPSRGGVKWHPWSHGVSCSDHSECSMADSGPMATRGETAGWGSGDRTRHTGWATPRPCPGPPSPGVGEKAMNTSDKSNTVHDGCRGKPCRPRIRSAGARGPQAFRVRGRVSVPQGGGGGEGAGTAAGGGVARPARAHRCRISADGTGETGGDAGKTAGWWPKSVGLLRPR